MESNELWRLNGLIQRIVEHQRHRDRSHLSYSERLSPLLRVFLSGQPEPHYSGPENELQELDDGKRGYVVSKVVDSFLQEEKDAAAQQEVQKVTVELNREHEEALSAKDKTIADLTRLNAKLNRRQKLNPHYILLLCLAIISCAALVSFGWGSKPTIEVTYNVGEIIAGILAGGGVAIAGTAYAVSKMKGETEE